MRNAALLFCVLLAADNEVDGQTLLGLTEKMIAHLLPTMKLQVRFSGLLAALKQQHSSVTPAPPASTPSPAPPSADESHGSASRSYHLLCYHRQYAGNKAEHFDDFVNM